MSKVRSSKDNLSFYFFLFQTDSNYSFSSTQLEYFFFKKKLDWINFWFESVGMYWG